MTTEAMFFYGTLRDSDVLSAVLGPHSQEPKIRPARLEDVGVFRVRNEDYPIALPQPGATAEGLLVEGLSAEACARLAFFEDEFDYGLEDRDIEVEGRVVSAKVFIAHRDGMDPDGPWDFEGWLREHKTHFLWAAKELMQGYGHVPMEECDALWNGIRGRVLSNWRAARQKRPDRLGSGMGRADVNVMTQKRLHQGFFGVEELSLQHRRFKGGHTPTLTRSVFLMTDAVAVLPWDPKTDEVLLIEQFRSALYARGDQAPWCLETIAGRMDGVEDTSATALREALEEAGLTLNGLEPVSQFYPIPGGCTEMITLYIGPCDLSNAGGHHGLDTEGEDIRAFTLPRAAAMEAVTSGEICTAPAIMALYHLTLHLEALQQRWQTG